MSGMLTQGSVLGILRAGGYRNIWHIVFIFPIEDNVRIFTVTGIAILGGRGGRGRSGRQGRAILDIVNFGLCACVSRARCFS